MSKPVSLEIKELLLKSKKDIFADLKLALEDIPLEHPLVAEHGDYATSLPLKLAKQFNSGFKQSPWEIAKRLADYLNQKKPVYLKKAEAAAPGFINFHLSESFFVKEMTRVLKEKEAYGSSRLGKGQTVIIDYSSPNIAKPFGIGHLRSTIIGQALYNLYKFSGYKVIGDNHLGDWGTQFGKLLYMIEKTQEKDFSPAKLEKLYVEFHRLSEEDKSLEEEARKWFKKLEDGDSKARDLWRKCVEISLKEFEKIYDLLGVKIDDAYGESFYEDKMLSVIEEAKKRGIAELSEGALIIEIPELKTPLILVKKDGATTYATRDLAAIKFRKETYSPDIIIYEVGAEQSLHFQQVFAAARMLGYANKETVLVHTKHGLYRLPSGKMSTRRGQTVRLEEILREAMARAEKLGSETEETATAVGVGAVKYFDLKHNVQSDIIFDWEKMFNLEGDSGPYLQYTCARARSVLRKFKIRNPKSLPRRQAGEINSNVQNSRISSVSGLENLGLNIVSDLDIRNSDFSPEESSILRYLYRFPEIVEQAARTYSPNLVCAYLYELARRFNLFYNNVPIIQNQKSKCKIQKYPAKPDSAPQDILKVKNSQKQKNQIQDFRLGLTGAVSIVLKNGLTLLGIETPGKI